MPRLLRIYVFPGRPFSEKDVDGRDKPAMTAKSNST
jgi:hypothetical protein